jgi:subtilisin family serine protease/subtilisin-like proprotein convertase family protein
MVPSLRSARPIRLLCESLEDRIVLSGTAIAQASNQDYRTDRILVQFTNTTATPAPLAGTHLDQSMKLVPGLWEVDLDAGTTVAQAVSLYDADPAVSYAQPDYLLTSEQLPNDPYLNEQWAYHNVFTPSATINAPAGWDTITGSGTTIVAVIDTGIDYTHPDLAANMWHNPGEIAGNGLDDDHNGYVDDVYGYNFVANNGNVMDDNGHGTHVAGIIGAVGNNGIGVTGVAWHIKLMALKFMDASGHGATSDALRALNYAVQMGAYISNNSWTSPASDPALEAGIRNAGAVGQIYVAAAGNAGLNIDINHTYPASYNSDNVVAVAALDSGNHLPGWSNWGPNTVAIAAPGSGIYSTLPGNRYGYMSGTSMAAPFVTGALALVHELHPDWNYRQVIAQVVDTADPLPSLTGKIRGGKLDLAAALGAPVTPPPSPPADTSGARVTGIVGLVSNNQINGLRITFSEPIQASTFTAADVLTLTGPSGALTVTGVTPVVGSTTQFDVTFAAQSQAGTYSITLGTDIFDLAGNPLNQNGNGINGENPGDRYSGSINFTNSNVYTATGMPVPLVDYGTRTSTLNVDNNFVLGKVRVQINIFHTWMSDLIVSLRSPNGTTVVLANRRGGNGHGYSNTTFDDAASIPIGQGVPLFTGTYRPEAPLSAFNGQNSSGVWTLIVQDKAMGDTGTLLGWSILLDPPAGGASLGDPAKSFQKPNPHDLLFNLSQRFDFLNQPIKTGSHEIVGEMILQRANSVAHVSITDHLLKSYLPPAHRSNGNLKTNLNSVTGLSTSLFNPLTLE